MRPMSDVSFEFGGQFKPRHPGSPATLEQREGCTIWEEGRPLRAVPVFKLPPRWGPGGCWERVQGPWVPTTEAKRPQRCWYALPSVWGGGKGQVSQVQACREGSNIHLVVLLGQIHNFLARSCDYLWLLTCFNSQWLLVKNEKMSTHVLFCKVTK